MRIPFWKKIKIQFRDIKEDTPKGLEYIEAIRRSSGNIRLFLKPSELFSEITKRGDNNFILEDLQKILTNIQLSTMGTQSEEDFEDLFSDMDLNSNNLGRTADARNTLIVKVLKHLDEIDFKLNDTELDVLGDAYEYLIGQFCQRCRKKGGSFIHLKEVSKILAKLLQQEKNRLKIGI